jgi:Carboxypeptidase regulatory-like domain
VVAVRRSDAQGEWGSGESEPGVYTVTVLAPGRPSIAGRVDVREEGARHDVVVPPARHVLDGVVRGGGGAPVPDSLVVLVDRDGGVVASTVTGDDGRFHFADLAPGRHMLTASGFAPVSEEVVVDGALPADVTVTVTPPRPAAPGRHEAPEETEQTGDELTRSAY